MSFTLKNGGNLNNGIMFNVTQNEDGSLNGYFFNITCHSWEINSTTHIEQPVSTGRYTLALWKMENWQLDTSFMAGLNGQMWCWGQYNSGGVQTNNLWFKGGSANYGSQKAYCLENWLCNSRQNIKYHISYENNNIIIRINDEIKCNIIDDTYQIGSYGFWGNNCEQYESMQITDFIIKTEQQKSFSDILLNSKYRDNTIKTILNVSNQIQPQIEEVSFVSKL